MRPTKKLTTIQGTPTTGGASPDHRHKTEKSEQNFSNEKARSVEGNTKFQLEVEQADVDVACS